MAEFLDMSRLKIGERKIERGAGDSASSSRCEDAGLTVVGPRTDGKHKELSDVMKNAEIRELFKKSLAKKTNMYSSNPDPLTSPWTFWKNKNDRGVSARDYESALVWIYSAYTVPGFWKVCENFASPEDMKIGTTLHMMRDGRKPMWEEACNRSGGTFRLCVQKKDTKKLWSEILVAAASEQLNYFLGENDEVCGVSLSIREGHDMVLIWDSKAEEAYKAKILEFVELLLLDVKIESKYYIPNVTHMEFDPSRAQAKMKNTARKLR